MASLDLRWDQDLLERVVAAARRVLPALQEILDLQVSPVKLDPLERKVTF